jgi:outer membrane protein TolC
MTTMARVVAIALVLFTGRAAVAARDLTLSDALALARLRRSEVTQAEIDIARARLGVLRAWLERAHLTLEAKATEQLQKLNLNGPKEWCESSPTACAGETHPFSATASLTVPIWSGMQVEADLAGARARRDVATANKRTTLLTVALDAATTYWEVRRAELDRDVAEKALERTREIERTAKIKVDAKIAPQVDYERAHVQTMRQAELVTLFDAQLATARAQLGLALQLDEDVRPVDDPQAHVPTLVPLEDLLAAAIRQRPELASATATVESERQNLRVAKSAYWPQLGLVGQATAGNQTFQFANAQSMLLPPFERVVFTAAIGLQVNWLIFDMLATWNNVRDAGLVRDRAQAALERERFQVRADVRAAHGRLAASLARRRAAAEGQLAARRALFLLQKRYQVGDAILIELLLAQQDLTQAENDLNDAAIDSAEAEAALTAATGQL